MSELQQLSQAEKALAVATTVEQVKEIYDMAEAYRVYAKNAAEQNLAAAFKLRAAAKGGAMLRDDPALGRGKVERLSTLFPGLSEVSRKWVSGRWQRVTALDDAGTLDAYLSSVGEEWDDDAGEVTMAGLFNYGQLGTLNSSESPEWYTPAPYIDAARKVLGGIDLDPASSAAANEVVQASRYFTAADDGLSQEWHGTVFLNPPYGRSAPTGCAEFIPKLVAEYEAGHTTAAITLTSAHGTETYWFGLLWQHGVLCFTNHRIAYWNEDGESAGPTFGSAFAYIGPEPEQFAEHFADFGVIVKKWGKE